MKPTDEGIKNIVTTRLAEIVRFGLVGVSNTIVYWALSTIVTSILIKKMVKPYVVGNMVAFIVSVAWSFAWNRKFVFHHKAKGKDFWRSLFRTYATYSFTGIILYNILSWVMIDIIGISYVIAPVINSIIGFPINYVLNRQWAFNGDYEDRGEKRV